MNNERIIRILLNVIDKLLALIDSLDTEQKLTGRLKATTDDLQAAMRQEQPTQEKDKPNA